MHWLEAESCKEQDSPPRRRRCRSQGLGPVAQGRDPLLWGQILAAVRAVSWGPNISLASGTFALPTRAGGLVRPWGLKAVTCPFIPYSQ